MNKKILYVSILFLILLSPLIYAKGTIGGDGNFWVWNRLMVNDYMFPESYGDANQALVSDGNGLLVWADANSISAHPTQYWTQDANNLTNTDERVVTINGSLILNQSVKEDLRFPVNVIKVSADFPPNITPYTLDFRDSRIEQAYIIAQMPHSRDTDTNLSAHFHYQTENDNPGNIVWGIEYSCASINDSFPDANTSTVVASSAEDLTKHLMSNEINIPATNLSASAICKIKIFRDPTDIRDTYIGDARLLEFDIHYYINKLGESA